jgi:hypothetical protein
MKSNMEPLAALLESFNLEGSSTKLSSICTEVRSPALSLVSVKKSPTKLKAIFMPPEPPKLPAMSKDQLRDRLKLANDALIRNSMTKFENIKSFKDVPETKELMLRVENNKRALDKLGNSTRMEQAKLTYLQSVIKQAMASQEYNHIANKEIKKKAIDMKCEVTATYEKFMSVYRFKSLGDNYSTSMHYYNRENACIEDNVNVNPEAICKINMLTSPYQANIKEYEGNIVSKKFKDNIVKNLGIDTICTV